MLVAAGCSSESEAPVALNVVFPSTAMAIASDEITFIAYDDSSQGACQRIYLKRISNQTDLPPVLAQSNPVAVCDAAFGRAAPLVLPFGKHAILAVATRKGSDLLIGCADVAVSSEGGEVSVDLALPGATPLPPISSCATLGEYCEDRCR